MPQRVLSFRREDPMPLCDPVSQCPLRAKSGHHTIRSPRLHEPTQLVAPQARKPLQFSDYKLEFNRDGAAYNADIPASSTNLHFLLRRNACALRPAYPFRAAEDGSPMTTTYGFDIARPRSRGARIARIDALATLLDTALVIPGTGVRFGLDALIGLFPVVGDAITTALSLFIVHEAYQLGVPGHVIARMLANVALDGVLGAVPLVGDAFDVMWRANRRNVRLLMEWLEHEHRR